MTAKPAPSASTLTLATILQSLRAARGWTQEDAAKKCNVRTQTYNSWECGRSETTLSSLVDVSAAFGVTIQVSPSGLRVVAN